MTTSTSTVTTARGEPYEMPPLESSPHQEGERQPACKTPHVFRPDARPKGFIGLLQTAGGIGFILLISSAYYLCISAFLYIILGPLLLGHVAGPATVAAIWLAQSWMPLVEYHQMPDIMRKSWLFRVRAFMIHHSRMLQEGMCLLIHTSTFPIGNRLFTRTCSWSFAGGGALL